MADHIDFMTLGMFIIDEIHFKPPTPSQYDILGGGGAYAALGARLLSPHPLSKTVGWIVDVGSDFPSDVRQTISSWDTGCLFRETPNRLTTRGWNGYGDNELRHFKYTTPKLRLDENSLDDRLLASRSFHLLCSAERCCDLVRGILHRRAQSSITADPLFVFEPNPDHCRGSELENLKVALKLVGIVSPNHAELCSFFDLPGNQDDSVHTAHVEQCSQRLLESGVGPNGQGAVVVRAGKDGCFVATRQGSFWLPAYFDKQPERVVDPTGGGNSFLGGFIVGLVRSQQPTLLDRLREAAFRGSAAASFAIEQVGMPVLAGVGASETWNGETVDSRLSSLRARVPAVP